MVCGLAEGRRKGGGRATIIEKQFENLAILNGMWIGGGVAEVGGRRLLRRNLKISRFSMECGLAEGRRKAGGRAAEGRGKGGYGIWSGGGRAKHLKMSCENLVILNGIRSGGRAAEGRRKGDTC